VLISTAAIADWRPAECAAKKLKKSQMDGVLRLVRNPDVLKTVSAQIARQGSSNMVRLVGFAAETGDALPEARRKCREKGLYMIVANDVTEKGAGFGTDTNRVALLMANGEVECLPLMSKLAVARRIIRKCEAFA
jgi:phosphopantothenoylcysteine decarboxylase/phosphopantothenate--cysteine ligase